jgi:hypothetical protein
VPLTLDRRVGFAGCSAVWGGGVAVLDLQSDPAVRTPARAWLVTVAQLADIVAQERHAPVFPVDVQRVRCEQVVTLGPGRYGTLVHCADHEGLPVLTCTSARRPGGWSAPAAGYLRWVARGLGESHGMSAAASASYLSGLPGAEDRWTAAEMEATLTTST